MVPCINIIWLYLQSFIITTNSLQPDETRHEINLVEDVRLVRGNDRQAEHRAKAGGEDGEPHQRANDGRAKPAGLAQVAQQLTPHDAAQRPQPVEKTHAAARVSAMNASAMDAAAVSARTWPTRPARRTDP